VTFVSDLGSAIPPIIGAFLAAAAIALVLTPIARARAIRLGVVDRPNHRRVNVQPVPRGGGLAMGSAFLIVAVVMVIANAQWRLVGSPTDVSPTEIFALLGGCVAAVLFGAFDDWFDLRARWQMLGQLVLAGAAIVLGIEIASINNPFASGLLRFSEPFAAGFTLLWIVGMINSVNFIDGLDGLSSGIGFIAAITLGILSLTAQVDQPLVAVLCFALAGSLLGFLRWNFHPATVFPGSSGTTFIGFALAVLSILGSAKVAVALLVLGVPIIDAFWIIVRRLKAGRSPFAPDRGHLHHRLLDLGLSHRQTVVLIYAICVGLGVLSLLLSGASQVYAFLGVFVGIGLLLLFIAGDGFGDAALEAESYVEQDRGAGRAT
jgi:UDP-GlcNAc:undecaprenyl-phosphate/decaprenyl-phosphate GlcNAc-1-phosphate transferase